MRFRLPTRPALVTGIAATALVGAATLPADAEVVTDPVTASAPDAAVALSPLGSYDTGIVDESAAEIVAHHAATQRALVVNAAQATVEVLDVSDPAAPAKLFDLQTTGVLSADGSVVPAGAVANSVTVRPDGLGVVAVESDVTTDEGWLVLFDAAGDGTALGAVRVGALPDMVTVTRDGARAVVANEGEPAEDYSADPEGSVAVVALPDEVAAPAQDAVAIADFHAFEGDALPDGIRVFGGREDAGTGTPAYPVSENLEPEYVTVDQQSRTAYVTLQEANGVAVVDLRTATVERIFPLGTVDRTEVPFDPSNEDGGIELATWPVQTFRQPDAITSFQVKGRTYLVTADEGDSRDWDGYSEEIRVKDLGEDGLPPVCPSVADEAGMGVEELQEDEHLGRLHITTAQGLAEDGSCYETLYGFGGRGISIWSTDGELVADTGAELEQITAAAAPAYFNSNNDEAGFDSRSDDKGPEPEGVTVGKVRGHHYAFVALERVGGVMVYDVTAPSSPEFVTYVNNRDFAADGGDLGPESLTFVTGDDSPTGDPVLIVANEVSGSTTLYGVDTIRSHRGR